MREEWLGSTAPGVLVYFDVLRGDERFPLGTTRRDPPALSLFSSIDREWVVWMPQGYYDTSISGDRRLLGWHVNRLSDPRDATSLLPSAVFPIGRFEALLRRPLALQELVATAFRAPT